MFSESAVDLIVSKKSEFDYLLYSQRWPITDCKVWKDKNGTNECSMPKYSNYFIVHGLWPTKNGTSGPNYCKSNITFNAAELDSLTEDLNDRWTNIEKGTDSYSFWRHEWQKHGTCASTLPQFHSVYKYFDISLKMNLWYDLEKVLSNMGIVPREEKYEVSDFINAILNEYNYTPQICCVIDSENRLLLSEIRLCFDKSLKMIDCITMGVNPIECRGRTSVFYLKKI